MPSTLTTEPIGPRSVDEMLGVVYGRADRLRRRRAAQRVAGAAAAFALAVGTLVSLGTGSDEARVRVVDDRGQQDEAPPSVEHEAAANPPPATEGPSEAPAPTGGDAPRQSPSAAPDAKAPDGRVPDQGLPAVRPAASAPVELWATADDVEGDAVPNRWYYDVVKASMKYEHGTGTVVFTTEYRTPDSSADAPRDDRVLESYFAYGSHTYAVAVREVDNDLGDVEVEGAGCTKCEADFSAASGSLVVRVPGSVLNEEIARHDSSRPLGQGAEIASLEAATSRSQGNLAPVRADVSGRGALS